jgi:ribosome-binding factor A
MTSRRVQKVAEAIREVVSMAILTDLNDPRIRDVTVTYVEVSGDLRHAKIHVSIMGDPTREKLSLRGLQSAAGYLQSKVAERIDTRWTPRIEFILDQGVKKSIAVSKILAEVLPRPEPSETAADEAVDEDTDDADQPEVDEVELEPRRPPPDPASSAPEQ